MRNIWYPPNCYIKDIRGREEAGGTKGAWLEQVW